MKKTRRASRSDSRSSGWGTHAERTSPAARRLRIELLEGRRLLSVGGTDAMLELFHAQDTLFAENAGQWAAADVYFGYNEGGTQIHFTDDSQGFGLSRRELKEGFDAADIDGQHGPLGAEFPAIGRIFPGLFPTQWRLGQCPVHALPFPLDAFQLVVFQEACLPQFAKHA